MLPALALFPQTPHSPLAILLPTVQGYAARTSLLLMLNLPIFIYSVLYDLGLSSTCSTPWGTAPQAVA